jgi:hypothetical protein
MNKFRITRGSKANMPNDLMYGEIFWQKALGQDKGTLFMGNPDNAGAPAMAIAGERAMKSLFFAGTHAVANAYPLSASIGDMYLMGVEGTEALADFKVGDFLIKVADAQWARINNQDTGSLGADAITFDGTSVGLSATTVTEALGELSTEKLSYGGVFTPTDAGFNGNNKAGLFFIADQPGKTLWDNVTQYNKGDAIYFTGNTPETGVRIPFSLSFPVNGVTFSSSTAGKLAKFDSNGIVADSIISDNGTVIDVAGDLTLHGDISARHASVGDPSGGDFTSVIKSAKGSGSVDIELPSQSGQLKLVTDHDTAAQISFDNTDTGVAATNVQGAIQELEKEKLQYAGTITSEAFPASPILGGLYVFTLSGTIGAQAFNKGDLAHFDGATWDIIPTGFTKAADIDTLLDGAVESPTGIAASAFGADVKTALETIISGKADVDGNGKIVMSQMPSTVVGGLRYKGTWDSSEAYPAGAIAGDYYVVSVASTNNDDYNIGDWATFNGTTWDKVDNSDKLSGIIVGGSTLVGAPEIAAAGAILVAAADGVITVSIADASATVKGAMQVGDGLTAVAGKVSVNAGDGVKIDAATKKVTLDLGNGVEIDSNSRLGIKVGTELGFSGTGELELAATGVAAGTHAKVTVDSKGRVTSGSNLAVADLPLVTSGAVGGTEIFDPATGAIASVKSVGAGVAVTKSGNLISLDFTQLNATELSAKFATTALSGFNWTSRATGTEVISGILGAVNANREDLTEFIELLFTKGAAVGIAAGANLVGVKGIAGVTPTGKTAGANGSVQELLEGLKAYTDAQITAFVPTGVLNSQGTGLTGKVGVFVDDDTIGAGNLSDNGSVVTSAVEVKVAERMHVQGATAEVRIDAANGKFANIRATEAGNSTNYTLPSVNGVTDMVILTNMSVLDFGDYDAEL